MINPTQAALLGLLHDGPQTGGDLNAIAQKWLAPYWNTTRSQVYRELPGLAENGYVKAGQPGKRNAVKYKITSSGKKAFRAWMKQSPGSDLLRNETVLRVALGAALREPEQIDSLLDEMIEHYMKQRDAIEALLKEAEEQATEYDVQALRFGLMYSQMMISWLETVELPE